MSLIWPVFLTIGIMSALSVHSDLSSNECLQDMVSLSEHICVNPETYVPPSVDQVIRFKFIEIFNDDPMDPRDTYELDIFEQCEALKFVGVQLAECGTLHE